MDFMEPPGTLQFTAAARRGPSRARRSHRRKASARAFPEVKAPATVAGISPLLIIGPTAAAGLVLVAVAFAMARAGAEAADLPFWGGVLAMVLPPAWLLVGSTASRSERLAAILLVGVGLYLVKVLHGPVEFVFGDELTHWRTAADILATGAVFGANPLSLVSPSYPGLEVATTALAELAGVSIYASGIIIIGAARIILVISLFLLAERLTRSARAAGIATLVYAASPNFAFWSAQFSYESLALPLAVLAMYLAVRHVQSQGRSEGFEAAAVLVILAIVATHHITGYAIAALLLAWVAAAAVVRRLGRDVLPGPALLAIMAGIGATLWLLIMARPTLRYIQPVLALALDGVGRVLSGRRGTKELFAGDPALVAPLLERILAFGAVAIIAAAIVFALVRLWPSMGRIRGRRTNSLVLVLAVATAAYLPLPALRFIQGTTEIANRSADFLFLPIGIVVGLAVVATWRRPQSGRPGGRRGDAGPSRYVRLGLTTMVVISIVGGIIIGMPRWARLPAGYILSGDTRALQPQSKALSVWFATAAGPGQRVLGDATNSLLLGSYGGQDIVHGLSWVYFSPAMGIGELAALRRANVQFVVVDRRVTTGLPVSGFYYESGEPEAGKHVVPMPMAQLERFENVGALRRVYDSGDIVVYAVVPSGAS